MSQVWPGVGVVSRSSLLTVGGVLLLLLSLSSMLKRLSLDGNNDTINKLVAASN